MKKDGCALFYVRETKCASTRKRKLPGKVLKQRRRGRNAVNSAQPDNGDKRSVVLLAYKKETVSLQSSDKEQVASQPLATAAKEETPARVRVRFAVLSEPSNFRRDRGPLRLAVVGLLVCSFVRSFVHDAGIFDGIGACDGR